jgi:hypothetical protein
MRQLDELGFKVPRFTYFWLKSRSFNLAAFRPMPCEVEKIARNILENNPKLNLDPFDLASSQVFPFRYGFKQVELN